MTRCQVCCYYIRPRHRGGRGFSLGGTSDNVLSVFRPDCQAARCEGAMGDQYNGTAMHGL